MLFRLFTIVVVGVEIYFVLNSHGRFLLVSVRSLLSQITDFWNDTNESEAVHFLGALIKLGDKSGRDMSYSPQPR